MSSINKFFLNSYRSDSVAFYLEMLNFACSIMASLWLAITAVHPNMQIIYPLFLSGSIAQTYASYRRHSGWIMMLTGYFTVANVFGMMRAFGVI